MMKTREEILELVHRIYKEQRLLCDKERYKHLSAGIKAEIKEEGWSAEIVERGTTALKAYLRALKRI